MKEELWEFVRSKYSKYSEIQTISGVRICAWNDKTQTENNRYSQKNKK